MNGLTAIINQVDALVDSSVAAAVLDTRLDGLGHCESTIGG